MNQSFTWDRTPVSGTLTPVSSAIWTPSPQRALTSQTDTLNCQAYLPPKYPSNAADYSIDWSVWSGVEGQTVSSGLITVEAGSGLGIVAAFLTQSGLEAAIINGGSPGNWHVGFQITYADGTVLSVEAILPVLDDYTSGFSPGPAPPTLEEQVTALEAEIAALSSEDEIALTGQTTLDPYQITAAYSVISSGSGVMQIQSGVRHVVVNLTTEPQLVLPPSGASWPNGSADEPFSLPPSDGNGGYTPVVFSVLASGRCLAGAA